MADQDFLFNEPPPEPPDTPEPSADPAEAPSPTEPKPRRKKAKAEVAELPFEKALERLEQIVAEMESGKLSLEDCMARYEEGTRLRTQCSRSLKSFEKRIEILMKENADPDACWDQYNG